VYLEGYELPVLNTRPTDPAPSPSQQKIVFTAKGWLWIMDLNTLTAKRITSTNQMDFRPNWSPNGEQIVFMRDNGLDTKIVLLDLPSGKVTILIDTKALDLDPIFSKDGHLIYYASAENDSIDLWQIDPSTMLKKNITQSSGMERLPVPMNQNNDILYLRKRGYGDAIELLDQTTGTSMPFFIDKICSQTTFTLSPDDRTLAYSWPVGDDYEIRLFDTLTTRSTLTLTKSEGLPLTPKFSLDGKWIYFTEFNKNERAELKRISINGGTPQVLEVNHWDWGTATSTIKIISKVDGKIEPIRMSITDQAGHPIIPETGVIHSEGQNGIVFFYSPGEIEIESPLGELTITAVHGFSTVTDVKKVILKEGVNEAEINFKKFWDPKANGWYAGDNHFHLNYGGTNQLDPEDIILDLKAEGIDVAFPMLANLGNKLLEQDLWGWSNDEIPFIQIAQEIRPHAIGHLGLIGTNELYWPWKWGFLDDIHGRDDRLNADVLRFARNQSALGIYVHPVGVRDPFENVDAGNVPISLVADGVLGEVDLLEVACLWTDEIGSWGRHLSTKPFRTFCINMHTKQWIRMIL